jgi:hypothetical protein
MIWQYLNPILNKNFRLHVSVIMNAPVTKANECPVTKKNSILKTKLHSAMILKKTIPGALLTVTVMLGLASCSGSSGTKTAKTPDFPPKPDPRSYVCYRTAEPVKIDGLPDEKAWADVPWTDFFVDIEGSAKPLPVLKTHAKLLWDDTNLYIASELEEPHVWATLRQRDTVIFYDNDFEVFIDPDADTHAYYELEVNAFGTPWDLLLIKPYRDGGPPVWSWDISGLDVAVHVDGTINNPSDRDRGWTVEEKIPLAALRECAPGLPKPGDKWRLGFSRVEWRMDTGRGYSAKEINPATGRAFPEDNWVWSPQGRINMHMPEMWGYLQFSAFEAGKGTETFTADPDFELKWALRLIYYAEADYFIRNNTYTPELADLGLKKSDLPGMLPDPVIETSRSAFEAYFPSPSDSTIWTIYQDGRLVRK